MDMDMDMVQVLGRFDHRLTITVGTRPRRCRGLCSSSRGAVSPTERRVDGDRTHLDEVVFRHQAKEPFVRLLRSSDPLLKRIYRLSFVVV